MRIQKNTKPDRNSKTFASKQRNYNFNPQHLLGDAATTDIRRHQSTNDCTAWQDLAFA